MKRTKPVVVVVGDDEKAETRPTKLALPIRQYYLFILFYWPAIKILTACFQ